MRRAKHHPLPTEYILEMSNLSAGELRLQVSNYYMSQEMRKRIDLQLRHLGDRDLVVEEEYKPSKVTTWAVEALADIESQLAKALGKAATGPIAHWLNAQRGIGPIITAGLLAEFDIKKAPTVGHFWSFAGLNPAQVWEEGKKRPFNPHLKVLCWKIGQSFMKQSGDPDCFYGHIYRERKAYEVQRNDSGGNAEKAAKFFVKPGATKEVKNKLKEGKLPDFAIDARARRYAVKIFLSHLHAVMFWDHHGSAAPLPYSHQMLGHVHFIDVPHIDMFPGLAEAIGSKRSGPRLQAAE